MVVADFVVIPWYARYPFVFAAALSMLFIGGDLLALNVGGATIRLVSLALLAATIFLLLEPKIEYVLDRTAILLFGAWAIAGCASILGSYNPMASISYTLWICFDFVFIVTMAYNLARRLSADCIVRLWFAVFRIHVVLLICELAARIAFHIPGLFGYRPHLWFYEPSYAAMFMGCYIASATYLAGYGRKERWLDVCLALLGLLLLGSATAIVAIFLAILIGIATPARWKIVCASALAGFVIIIVAIEWFSKSEYFYLIGGFLTRTFQSGNHTIDLAQSLIERSGNRYVRALIGLHAFAQHPWLGIGIGADEAYMSMQPFTSEIRMHIMQVHERFAPNPFTNIFIDVLASMGIIGFIPFVALLIYSAKLMIAEKIVEARIFFISFFVMILLLQIDGNFLRYYLWLPYGLGLGLFASGKDSKVEATGDLP